MNANTFREPKPHPARPEARRQAIVAYVTKNPGCSLRRAAAGAHLSPPVAQYYVRILELQRKIVVYRDSASWSLFPFGWHVANAAVAALHKDADVMRLWSWMEGAGSLEQQAVLAEAQGWGWPASTIRRRIGRLIDAGVLIRVKEPGRLIEYRLALRSTPSESAEPIDAF